MTTTSNKTITRDEALLALHALEKAGIGLPYATRYVELTGIVPEELTTISAYCWLVFHGEKLYKTSATSEASAVNNIRFNLYGKTPAADVGPFRAVNPARIVDDAIRGQTRRETSASRLDFAKRLARMRRAV